MGKREKGLYNLKIFDYIKKMIITEEWIVKNKTQAGGYNKKQFEILGIQYPPKRMERKNYWIRIIRRKSKRF